MAEPYPGRTTSLLQRVWTLLLALRCAIFLVPWLAHLFVADVLLSALLPVSAALPTLAYRLSSIIAELVWRGIQAIFTRVNGARIVITGDELPQGESAIVVSNHVEWTDFYMIQELALRAGMLGRCRWFAKQQLKWVPFLGWGLWAMGMPLVSRKWVEDKREMDRVFHGAVERKWPICRHTSHAIHASVDEQGPHDADQFTKGSYPTAKPHDSRPRSAPKQSSGRRRMAK